MFECEDRGPPGCPPQLPAEGEWCFYFDNCTTWAVSCDYDVCDGGAATTASCTANGWHITADDGCSVLADAASD